MAIYSIYRFTNLTNGKVYIGQTVQDPLVRFQQHIRSSERGKDWILSKAIRKYGVENFHFEVIFNTFDVDSLDEYEVHFIQEHDCCILDGPANGYNMIRGGTGFTTKQAQQLSQDRVVAGTHNWQGDLGRAAHAERIAAGTHHSQTDEWSDYASTLAKTRIANGTHNWTSSARKTNAKKASKNALAKGTHSAIRKYVCDVCGREGKGPRFKGSHFGKCKTR